MKKDALDKILCALETKMQHAGKTSPTANPRLFNIEWIKKLSRRGLSYEKKERQLLVYTTSAGEKIFMQYPGKESGTHKKNGKERKKTAIRPWDFRPILYPPNSKYQHKDMSFGAMWATIFKAADKVGGKNKKEILCVLATLLYRMAFMLDHVELKTFKTQIRNVTYKKNGKTKFSRKVGKTLPRLFKYKPNKQVLGYISKSCPRWGDMSFEGFLFYNELLVWNEDCKYYYRNYHIRDDKEWISTTGRVNTLLTHIRILGHILEKVPLSDIFDGFARQKGISPASKDEILKICGGFIRTT